MPAMGPCWAAHTHGAATSPAASLAERVESGQAAVTLPARHGGLAGAGARVVTLQAQRAWEVGEGGEDTGHQGPARGEPSGWGGRAHSPAGWQSHGWQGAQGFQR